jgi:hypothetical protein
MRTPVLFSALLMLAAPAVIAQEMWELPPILYSKTRTSDPVGRLSQAIARGETRLSAVSEEEMLRFLLNLLEIPVSSQILVYSKTSAQNYFISPKTPRALYYNENAYVGHVPGGGFEIIAHDPQVGTAFYFIERRDGKYTVERDTSSCLNCHATRRTELVPGLTVRSVPTDPDGNLLLTLGSTRTDHRTPIGKRWAGYYVTGSSSLPHLGNRTFSIEAGLGGSPPSPPLADLKDRIDVSPYPRATSDIVSLMLLEHQCHVHNLLIRIAIDYRRAVWHASTLGDPAQGDAPVDAVMPKVRELADALLFKDEAAMGETGVDGSAEFQKDFTARFPKAKDGGSLADFHLGNRLFKNRCSYMIYSKAFGVLPEPAKEAVFAALRERLEDGGGWIGRAERQRVVRILTETVPGFP